MARFLDLSEKVAQYVAAQGTASKRGPITHYSLKKVLPDRRTLEAFLSDSNSQIKGHGMENLDPSSNLEVVLKPVEAGQKGYITYEGWSGGERVVRFMNLEGDRALGVLDTSITGANKAQILQTYANLMEETHAALTGK